MKSKRLEEELNILKSGTVEVLPEGLLELKLKESDKSKKPLRVKLGADPSAPDLHLGHTVVLRKLREFQDLGHKVIFIIGDFTAMIGDPTGKTKTRKPLSREEIERNAKTYKDQIYKVLDESKTEVVYNSSWNKGLCFEEVLGLTNHVTVARLLERDDFSKRYKEGESITLTEFMYTIIQAYDSVKTRCDIELGGTDQKFNLLMGRQFQKELGASEEGQVCITMPILEGLDGHNKMSKSLNNYVRLYEGPDEMYGKLMSIPDTLIMKYFRLLTDLGEGEILKYEQQQLLGRNPRELKALLGHTLVRMYYNEEVAKEAGASFDKVFRDKGLPKEMANYSLEGSNEEIWVVKLMQDSGLVQSSSECRRLIRGGGVSLNGEKVLDENHKIRAKDIKGGGMVLKVGRRRFVRVLK